MPYDLDDRRPGPPEALRPAILELIAARETGRIDETDLRAALGRLIVAGRRPVDDLWQRYHGGRPDRRGRVLARYAD